MSYDVRNLSAKYRNILKAIINENVVVVTIDSVADAGFVMTEEVFEEFAEMLKHNGVIDRTFQINEILLREALHPNTISSFVLRGILRFTKQHVCEVAANNKWRYSPFSGYGSQPRKYFVEDVRRYLPLFQRKRLASLLWNQKLTSDDDALCKRVCPDCGANALFKPPQNKSEALAFGDGKDNWPWACVKGHSFPDELEVPKWLDISLDPGEVISV